MKRPINNRRAVAISLVLAASAIAVAAIFSTTVLHSSTLSLPPGAETASFALTVPLPPLSLIPPVPTGPPGRLASATPPVISKRTDLAKGLPDNQKLVVRVRRSGGMFEEFLIPRNFRGSLTDLREVIGVLPGDVIVSSDPLVEVHSTPPVPTPVAPRQATPTSVPYP